MKQILIKILIVLLIAILSLAAIICAELIGEFLFKRTFGWEGSHADFILFLLSDNSAFCTGGVYPIDGGYLAE